MAKYVLQWRYASGSAGPWEKGDIVEIDDDLAEWINRDSKGVLKRHVTKPAKTRQVRRTSQTRGKKKVADE